MMKFIFLNSLHLPRKLCNFGQSPFSQKPNSNMYCKAKMLLLLFMYFPCTVCFRTPVFGKRVTRQNGPSKKPLYIRGPLYETILRITAKMSDKRGMSGIRNSQKFVSSTGNFIHWSLVYQTRRMFCPVSGAPVYEVPVYGANWPRTPGKCFVR